MKNLILATVIATTLTACQKKPDEHSSEAQASIDSKTQVESSLQVKEQEAEAAAIAHDRYDPDSTYTTVENIDIPPPQLKRELLPGEALEVKFRPVDSYPNFKVITSTVLDTTRLKVVSEIEDVLDKVEMDNQNCKVIGVEPFTVEFPKKVYYGNIFNLVLKGCTAEEINEVYLYTTHGKLTYRAIVEE